jgi:hypothetical protein
MDIAKCTLDERTYTAVRFSELPPNELSDKRQNLVCTECQADAFFRKASRSGQAACFGARPHIESCSFASPETQTVEAEGGDEDIVHNPGQIIEIDLNFGAATTNVDIEQNENDDLGQGRAGRHIGRGKRPNTHMHRRLSSLLRNLINSYEFRSSHQKIELEGKEATSVKDFFVNFNDVTNGHDGKFHGYWGLLTDARIGNDNTLWLNSGGRGAVSCVISSSNVDALYARYNIEDEEDFAGAYILIIGKKDTSQNGKQYIRTTSVNHLVVRKSTDGIDLDEIFFRTEKTKLAFLLKKHVKGVFDEELGIKKKHYIDKTAAKEWKTKLLKEFHPDKNLKNESLDFDEITQCINKIYNRMVGKA